MPTSSTREIRTCRAPLLQRAPLGNCTVSVVNLTSNTVTATIPIPGGHPNFIAATTGTPTGKVYVTSPESKFMTIIRTDTDSVDTTIPLQGNGCSGACHRSVRELLSNFPP